MNANTSWQSVDFTITVVSIVRSFLAPANTTDPFRINLEHHSSKDQSFAMANADPLHLHFMALTNIGGTLSEQERVQLISRSLIAPNALCI